MMLSLQEFISERLGVRVRERENAENEAMTTAAALVLRADSSRLAASVINLGQSDVFLRPRRAPSATVGIRLGPNGGSMTLMAEEDFSLVGLDWFGATALGTSTLYVLEEIMIPEASVVEG